MSLGHGASIVRDGLVLHVDAANVKSYPGSGNTWSDLSGNGNNATLTGSPTYVSNESFSFDATNDYANAGVISNLDGSSKISLEAWIKVDNLATTDRKIICYKRDANTDANFQLRRGFNTDGLYYQWHSTTWQTFSIDNFFTNTTDWHHVAIVHNPSVSPQIVCYRNGEQFLTSTGNSTPLYWQAATLFIGYRTASEYFDGDISIVKLYNRDLSANEIKQNFEATRGRYGI